nr:iq domain-containing protein iqm1 [Quercus suber]
MIPQRSTIRIAAKFLSELDITSTLKSRKCRLVVFLSHKYRLQPTRISQFTDGYTVVVEDCFDPRDLQAIECPRNSSVTIPTMAEQPRDVFLLPPPEELRRIAARQEDRAKQIKARRAKQLAQQLSADKALQEHAAEIIQRNFRGYRDRRALKAHYATKTDPKARQERLSRSPSNGRARSRWQHVSAITHRAGSDDTSDSDIVGEDDTARTRHRETRRKQKLDRERYAKVMGLEYFLEMVDQKHRYGSNLRRYHQEWKKADTHDNFFYWLDYGEGKSLDLEDRPRERLDTEQVRYLSREERQRYLVNIDKAGRFCWNKDGKPVTTSTQYKDSINGIVAVEDQTPTWREVTTGVKPEPPASSDSESVSGISTGSQEDASKYGNPELHDAKGIHKLNHISADSLANHLLRKTTKKNTWIFVADTSFRLYIGIKQSGAFQHSSFLKGARVSAAGLIKVKRGQIRKISPLSGHYAPPVRNFREFVRNLKTEGADMSHCNISRSYAVLLGLEGYLGAKRHVKFVEQGLKDMLRPEEKRKREEAEKDKSQSAEKERQVLQKQEEELRRRRSLSVRFMRSLGITPGERKTAADKETGER